MKAESSIKPNKYIIENKGNGKVTVSFFDDIQEIEIAEIASEEKTKKYVYNIYTINIFDRSNLAEELEKNFESWLKFAKDCEYEKLAAEVRIKRDELLKESDAEMCLDRMGLEMPEGTSFTSWINFLKTLGKAISGNIAKYRQALRDIPEQPGFPYEVTLPTKEESEGK